MIWPWKKKKDKQEEIEVPKHQHVFKDMPWYMEEEYSGQQHIASYKIVEPYICITCGERKNVTLERQDWSNISAADREKEYNAVRKRYKDFIKPRAIVEDMINNILLVKDARRLNMLEKMYGYPHQNIGTSAEQMQVKEIELKIDLPKDKEEE